MAGGSALNQPKNAGLALTSYPPFSLNHGVNISAGQTVYSYSAVYDGAGNVTGYNDTGYNHAIMGGWGFTYDTLNRLLTATSTSGDYSGQNECWSYDSFGNRTAESPQTSSCPTPETSVPATARYNANNQVTWTTVNSAVNGFTYDPSGNGNVVNDNLNQYLYDAEGRICAVSSTPMPGDTRMIGYLYNAEGVRVAKGSITTLSCNLSINNFQLTESYVLGQGGEELTMLDGNNSWQRTNVYGAGKLLATYDPVGLHFHLTDPLGTRRLQTSSVGQPETDIQSLPFGNQLNSFPDPSAGGTADDSTPLHFTGKERDAESGNDYFDARYYSSAMGRFMSPDWSAKEDPVPYAQIDDPQSLNLYSYVRNNPLTRIDPDGHFSCGGENAKGISCQFLNNWDKEHGVGQDGAQQQSSNSSSKGTGFWSHVGNLLHGHSWNYGMRESVTMKLLPPDFYSVNGSVGYFSGSLSYVPATNNLIVSPGGGTKSPLGGWPRSDSPEKVWVTGGPGLTLPTKSGCPMSGFSDMGCRM